MDRINNRTYCTIKVSFNVKDDGGRKARVSAEINVSFETEKADAEENAVQFINDRDYGKKEK